MPDSFRKVYQGTDQWHNLAISQGLRIDWDHEQRIDVATALQAAEISRVDNIQCGIVQSLGTVYAPLRAGDWMLHVQEAGKRYVVFVRPKNPTPIPFRSS